MMLWAVRFVVAIIVACLLWDGVMISIGNDRATFCEACRVLNRESNALFALGCIALFVHIFLLPLLPSWWRYDPDNNDYQGKHTITAKEKP